MSKALLQNGITQAEYTRVVWSVTPEAGTTLADMLTPSYWAHVARQFKVGALIEVRPTSNDWFALLYVWKVDANSMRPIVLHEYELSEETTVETPPEQYEVLHRGPRGWSVVRVSDRAVMFENGTSKVDAERWVAEQSIG